MALHKANPFLNAAVEFKYNGEAVGRGKVLKVSNLDVLHGSKLPRGCYGIAVLSVYGGENAPLAHPLPHDNNITTLKDAINTSIVWQKDNLVYFACQLFISCNIGLGSIVLT